MDGRRDRRIYGTVWYFLGRFLVNLGGIWEFSGSSKCRGVRRGFIFVTVFGGLRI